MMTYIIYQTIQSSSRRTFLNRLFHENNAVELKLNYRPSGNWRAECITKCRVYNLQLYKDLIIGHSNEQFELKFLVIRLYIFLLLFNSIISILMIKVYNIYTQLCPFVGLIHRSDSFSALVGSLTIGTTFFLSPVAGILTDKIGIQLTTFIGGALAAAGMFLSSLLADRVSL